VPTVTSLRAERHGRVAVELDGVPWRVLPAEAVLRAGLVPGLDLDRERLRLIGRELRRGRALGAAARALRRRDLSIRALDARLERAGVAPQGRRETLETLARAGLVDDERFAVRRAEVLADRGHGDASIRWELEREGLSDELIEHALAGLEPELERARRIVTRRGAVAATARLLARRGFGEDAIADAFERAPGKDA
jgi:SOS response regulatory protein OraA/RecX